MAKEKRFFTPLVTPPPAGGYSQIDQLKIKSSIGTIEHNGSPIESSRLSFVVMLGAIRQREMWTPFDQPGDSALLCESKNFETGNPRPQFPWEDSVFDEMVDYPTFDKTSIKCGDCSFKNWTKGAFDKRSTTARCTETVAVPILLPVDHLRDSLKAGDAAEINFELAYLKFQRSALKPINDAIKESRLASMPLYSKAFALKLRVNLGSSYQYSVPDLVDAGYAVNPMAFPKLSAVLHSARDRLLEPTPTREPGKSSFFGVGGPDPIGHTGTFFN